MEWTTIIVALISALAGGGLLRLTTIKPNRELKNLENKEKALEIEEKKRDDILDEWKELAADRKQRVLDLQETISAKDVLLEEKDATIAELRETLDSRNSEVTALKMIRCKKLNCPDRIPPYGYAEINIREGVLVEEQ